MAEQLKIDVVLKNFASKELAVLEKGILNFGKGAVGAFKGVLGSVFSLKGALVGLASGFAVKGVFDLVKHTAEAADKIGDLSKELGVSTEALSELQLAAEDSGAGMEELATGFKFLQKSLGEFAITGKGAIKDVFSVLGPEFRTLVNQGAPVEEIFQQISREIKGLGAAEKVFVTSQLFGRGGSKLLPLLVEDLDKAREAMRRFGGTITGEMAVDADEFNHALKEVHAAFSGLQTQVVSKILPDLTKALKVFVEIFLDNKPAILGFFADVIEGMGTMAKIGFNAAAGFSVVSGAVQKLIIQAKILRLEWESLEVAGKLASNPFGALKLLQIRDDLEDLREELRKSGDASEDAAEAWRKLGDTVGSAADKGAAGIKALGTAQKELPSNNPAFFKDAQGGFLGIAEAATVAKRACEGVALVTTAEMFEATNAIAGAGRAFKDLKKASTEWGVAAHAAVLAVADSIAANVTDGLMAMIDGTKSAKEAFRDMAKGILKDIAQIIIQTLILKAVQGAFGAAGFATGGVVPGHIQPVSGHMAGGGIVRNRGLFEIGERGQHEAVVPLIGNRAIPVAWQGRGGPGGGGGGVVVNSNVYYNSTAMTGKQQDQFIASHANQIAKAVASEFKQSPTIREAMRAA